MQHKRGIIAILIIIIIMKIYIIRQRAYWQELVFKIVECVEHRLIFHKWHSGPNDRNFMVIVKECLGLAHHLARN
jgi:hypothetical protein